MPRYATLEVKKIAKQTDVAYLIVLPDGVETDDGEKSFWLPKSQMEDPDECDVGDENVEIQVASWLIRKKGLE